MRKMQARLGDIVERALVAWEEVALATAPLRAGLAAAVVAGAEAQAARTRRAPLTWGTVYAALVCAVAMALVDRPLALWLKAHVGGDVEGFFKVVTHLGLAGYTLVPAGLLTLAAWLAARRALLPEARRRCQRFAWRAGYVFLAVAVPGLVGDLIKVVVGRARPRLLLEQGFYGVHPFSHGWVWESFPSGHSNGAFAAAMALVVLVPRYDLLWLLVAVLVAASRVATTVHYFSDVVAGGWLGVAGAVLMARWFRRKGVDL